MLFRRSRVGRFGRVKPRQQPGPIWHKYIDNLFLKRIFNKWKICGEKKIAFFLSTFLTSFSPFLKKKEYGGFFLDFGGSKCMVRNISTFFRTVQFICTAVLRINLCRCWYQLFIIVWLEAIYYAIQRTANMEF